MVLFVYLFQLVVDVVVSILLIQLLMQYLGSPSFQFPGVAKPIGMLLRPVARFFPRVSGIDTANLFLCIAIVFVMVFVANLSAVGVPPGLVGCLLMAIVKLTKLLANVFIYSVLFCVLATWFAAIKNTVAYTIATTIAAPLMTLGQRYVPRLGGLDLSYLAIIFVIWLLSLLVLQPLMILAMKMAYA